MFVYVTYIFHLFVFLSVTYYGLVFRERNMVQRINEVFSKYQDRLREIQAIPRLSYERGLQRRDGAPNRMFLTCLFCHHELAFQFLKDVVLSE